VRSVTIYHISLPLVLPGLLLHFRVSSFVYSICHARNLIFFSWTAEKPVIFHNLPFLTFIPIGENVLFDIFPRTNTHSPPLHRSLVPLPLAVLFVTRSVSQGSSFSISLSLPFSISSHFAPFGGCALRLQGNHPVLSRSLLPLSSGGVGTEGASPPHPASLTYSISPFCTSLSSSPFLPLSFSSARSDYLLSVGFWRTFNEGDFYRAIPRFTRVTFNLNSGHAALPCRASANGGVGETGSAKMSIVPVKMFMEGQMRGG
jgi:hypothetical protein